MRDLKKSIRLSAIAAMLLSAAFQFTACSDDDSTPKIDITGTTVATPQKNLSSKGVFVLNEGAMGTNKSSLDYFDYTSGNYYLNLFPTINPNVTLGLGDTGNDIQIYKGKVYAVMNGSNLVEVLSAKTGKHIASIDIPKCRFITFDGNYAYVSSYADPADKDSKTTKGSVYKVNLNTNSVESTVTVGYQPEGIAFANGKLFVANSGGYMYPNYEHSINVIDPQTMQVEKTIDAGLNLGKVALDKDDNLYVISTGNYSTVSSKIYVVNTAAAALSDSIDTRVSAIAAAGDNLYIIGVEYKAPTYEATNSYSLYNTKTKELSTAGFITDGTDSRIVMPYAVAVNPDTKEIFVADAKDYKTPGMLYCYSAAGKLQWSATTGLIPGHMAFTTTQLKGLK